MQKTYHFSTEFQWQVIENCITVRRKPKWEIRKIWEGMELMKRGFSEMIAIHYEFSESLNIYTAHIN